MKRIIVTGGAGFIGSHLVDRLMERGDEVTVVDNLYTGTKRNFVHHLGNPRFEFIRHDITEPILLEADEVYHLACPASPAHYQANPVKTIKTNVMGTINMLGLAKRVKARFLLASTSEVYGDPKEHPQRESYWGHVNPIGPRSCYDEGKRVAETLTVSYRTSGHVRACIVRIFNTYGPRMQFNDGRVVSNFIHQALTGRDLTLYGDGSQTRSFCFVSDLVSGLIKAMDTEACEGPVNLGNPIERTVSELARMVLAAVPNGDRLRVTERPLPQDDPTRRRPDISRAKAELDWEPVVPLEEGIARTVVDFSQRLASGGKG